MTSQPNAQPEPVAPQRMAGLAIAALAIGVGTLVSAGAAWGVWLLAELRTGRSSFGWFAYTPLNHADYLPIPSYPDFVGLAGPVWFAMLPIAAVGLVFARAVRRRETPVPGVRAGTVTAVIALVLAVAGLVVLIVLPGATLPTTVHVSG